MKTYLELEGKLGPKPQLQSIQFRSPLPDTNPQVRKKSKVTEKRKRLIPTKKYKVKVVARPDPSNTTTHPPQANAKAPVNPESQQSPTSENNCPSLEDALICASTPWPEAGRMSGNLFELRKDWPIPPANNTATTTAINPKLPVVKVEPQDPDQSNPSSTVPKQEQCRWGPNCPICKNAEEDWDGEHQKQFQQTDKNTQTKTQQKYSSQTQDIKQAQAQSLQCTKDNQVPQNQPT